MKPEVQQKNYSGPIEKLPVGKKILFGAGDSTFSLLFTTLNFYFLYFLTDGVGISAALAGWVFFAGKIWDAFSDPIMGYLSDRTKSRWGRRRPYLLFGAAPLALTYIILWQAYPIQNQTMLLVLYSFLAVLFFSCFTLTAVPYAAMIPELTLDYNDRTSLVSFRMMFSIILSIAGAALPMMFVEAAGGDVVAGFRTMAILFGLLGTLPLLVTFLGTSERFARAASSGLSLKKAYQETLKNRPFRFAMLVFLLSWVTIDVIGVVFVYFVTYYLNRRELINVLFLTMLLVAALFLPFWYLVAKKLGKRWSYIIGTGFWALVMLLLIFLSPGTGNWVLILMSGLAGIGVSTAHVIPWALIPECVDYDELSTGERREGMYTGFLTFLQKFASSFAILLVGSMLGISGYEAGIAQNPRTLLTIRVLLGPLPCILLLLSMILAYLYPITRERYVEIRQELEKKKSISARAIDKKVDR